MAKIYPNTKRLFQNLKGRKAKYSPQNIADEFKLYIEDLAKNPIELETEYTYKSKSKNTGRQTRVQKFPRPPKILDFVNRWLGMTHQWWYMLPSQKKGEEYSEVIRRITQYCFDTKFDGAVVGIYNANIISRDLGLKENVTIERIDPDENMTDEELAEEIKRLKEKILEEG